MKKFYISLSVLSIVAVKAQSFQEISQPALKDYFYSAAAVADFDNDGSKDIFFTGAIDSDGDTNVDETSNQFYKNVNGTFSVIQDFSDNAVHLSAVESIDFDNDGLLDIITTGLSYNDVVNYKHYRFKNTGSGFAQAEEFPGKIYGGLGVFDLNHDGKQDYAVNGTQYVHGTGFTHRLDLYLNGASGFQAYQTIAPGTQNGSFNIIDLNNDHELDLIINGYDSDEETVSSVYINENGKLVKKYDLPLVSDSKMAFADFDGDGFQDFVMAGQDENYDPYLAYFINDGQGSFTENKIENEGLSDGAIEVGDLNNDGFYDFVVIGDNDYEAYTKVFYYNPQLKKFEKDENSGVYNLGSKGTLALFDYDNDGNLDILANGFDWSDPDMLPYTKLFKNNTTVSNQKPNPPAVLNTSAEGKKLMLNWSGATDDKTPVNALQYEISVGSESGKADIAKYIVTTSSWYLDTSELPSKIYWSVRSIDAAGKYSAQSQENVVDVLSVSNDKMSGSYLYPNPVKTDLNIKSSSKIKSFKVYNLAGQDVQVKLKSDVSIDFTSLAKGAYIVQIVLENGEKINQKVIKN